MARLKSWIGRHVRLEVPMIHQYFDGLCIRQQGAWLPLIPQPVGVPDAIGAVQGTTLDMVQAEAALAVLNHVAGSLR